MRRKGKDKEEKEEEEKRRRGREGMEGVNYCRPFSFSLFLLFFLHHSLFSYSFIFFLYLHLHFPQLGSPSLPCTNPAQ